MIHRLTQDISGTAHVPGSSSWSAAKALGLETSEKNAPEAAPDAGRPAPRKTPGLLVRAGQAAGCCLAGWPARVSPPPENRDRVLRHGESAKTSQAMHFRGSAQSRMYRKPSIKATKMLFLCLSHCLLGPLPGASRQSDSWFDRGNRSHFHIRVPCPREAPGAGRSHGTPGALTLGQGCALQGVAG